jgi:nitrilase
MPLPRFSLFAQGVEIYVAPTDEGAPDSTMRHIAAEGGAGCWATDVRCGADIQEDFPQRASSFPTSRPGTTRRLGSSTAQRDVAGPMHGPRIVCRVRSRCIGRRRASSKRGRAGRLNIFHLEVNQEAMTPIEFG